MTTHHRPQHLDEMIGQEAIKQKARIAIQAAMERGDSLPHVLLTSAGGGLGKSSFANVLATECLCPLVATTGQCLFGPVDLRNILVRIEPGTFLLVDEFHGIGRLAAEELLLVLEEGVLNVNVGSNGTPLRIEVPRFTLVAASTQPEAISAPLQQRFGLSFRFGFYSVQEIQQIVQDIFRRWGLTLEMLAASEIAQRARGVPRIALRLAERVRDVAQAQSAEVVNAATVELTMGIEGIDSIGLTQQERQLLCVLADAEPHAVSARSLSLAMGVGVATTTDVLEPALVRLGLMMVGAGGRRLTDKGRQHLQSAKTREVA